MTERILVVDDDEEICHFIEKTLNAEGYEAESVHSAKEAIRFVRETRFNLVILDNKLPDVDGIDLLTQLNEIDSDLDIIIISGYASLETVIRAIDNGAASYIVKPLDLREILPKVAMVLEKQRLVRENKQIEQALKESGMKYRSLFENLPVGLAYHRIAFNDKGQPVDYVFIDVNQHFEALTGLDRKDLLGKPASQILTVLGKKGWIERYNTVVQTGVRTSFDQYSEIMGRWFSVTAYCPKDEYLVAAFIDITERKQNEKELQLEGARLQALWELNQMGETSTDSLIEFAREQAVKLTGSHFGYVAFVNEDQNLLLRKSWSYTAMKECEVPREKTIFPVAETGLWGEPVRLRKPVIINDYAAPNPLKNGYPEGHIEISRYMSIPVFDGDKIVATAGVANKKSDYSNSDARQLTLLMQGMWTLLQRRESEKALKESEERYRHLFENAQVGIFRTSIIDGTVVECNETGAQILGYNNPDEVKAEYVASEHYVDPTIRQKMLDLLAEEGKFTSFQAQVTTRDGIPLWLEFSATLFPEEGYLESIVVDISERKQTQEELEKAAKKYRNLVEESMQGVAIYQAGRFVYANPAFAATLGYDVEEIIQLSPEDVRKLIHHEDRETIMKRFGSLEAGLHFLPRISYRYLDKTGAVRWVESYSRKIKHDGKSAIQLVEINITERRLAEEQMRSAAETAILHIDLMGHDIRNHLQAIIMAADILTYYDTNTKFDKTLELIVQSVEKSQTLIGKITSTRDLFSEPLADTCLKEVLDESLRRIRGDFQDVKINVEYTVTESTILADQFLENMLLNLLENAVLHNDNQVKRLWIVMKEINEGFEVTISDNGPGIDDSRKEDLFDPGRRFGGVGLHQALRIVRKYRGKLSIDDRVNGDPGKGAKFRIWIPRLLSSTP